MKTIFIVITRGFIVRNILRSGILTMLKQKGHKIVVILPARDRVPQYLKDEFEDDQVVIEGVREVYPKGHSFFSRLTGPLVYSDSTWVYGQIGNLAIRHRMPVWRYVERIIYFIPSKITFFKRLTRFIDYHFFKTSAYDHLFEKYAPDVVFSTSIVSKLDVAFMKEARRHNVTTISMPKGWDNISKALYRIAPDYFIVQNNLMKQDLMKYQDVPESKITVTGFPQFDWYRKKEILEPRETFMQRFGFKGDDKLIFFGSEGAWSPDDHKLAEILGEAAAKGSVTPKASVLARPHFSDINSNRFEHLKDKPSLAIDTHFNHSSFFIDNWDPDTDEVKYFTNLIYHTDVLVTIASTLTLDAAAYDKPLINVAFGGLYDVHSGKDVTDILYNTNHSQWVLKSGAVSLVNNKEELINTINHYLAHPEDKHEERKNLIDTLCYKVDGKCSERIVNVITNALS